MSGIERIMSEPDLKEILGANAVIDDQQWTCVIPAAGKGTRLGYHYPKILYPLLGKPIIHFLVGQMERFCSQIVVVASPEGAPEIDKELTRIPHSSIVQIVIQKKPIGMADAVWQARDVVTNPNTVVLWGDQVCLLDKTILMTLALHQLNPDNLLTFPTILKKDPYIHFQRNDNGRIQKVLQRRENEIQVDKGENDCGFFSFSTDALFSVLSDGLNSKQSIGSQTQELNLLQLFPKFESMEGRVTTLRIATEHECLGINTIEEAQQVEAIIQQRLADSQSKKVRVAMFSGGRGTATLTKAFINHPQIDLTLLVNAYDDGLSTGSIRRFVSGLLGPSDVRKNIARLISDTDGSGIALKRLLEYRLPKTIDYQTAFGVLSNLLDESNSQKNFGFNKEFWDDFEKTSFQQVRYIDRQLRGFLDYCSKKEDDGELFDFADCSFGNLVFAGAFLNNGKDFNQTIESLSQVFSPSARVINVTQGENLVLVGLKSDGKYLQDEAEIVSPQNTEVIEEIYLLENYLDAAAVNELNDFKDLDSKKEYLSKRSFSPSISKEAQYVLENADIIIYGPGTQHSSLFPSYLTQNVSETIAKNLKAEKIFLSNTRKDHEIQGETINSLCQKLHFYLTRKGILNYPPMDLVTHYFFQIPGESEHKTDFLKFDVKNFSLPAKQVLVTDWESTMGKHSGGRVLDELIAIVNERAKSKMRSLSHMVSIVVPVLNEEKTLGKVLTRLNLLNLQPMGLDKEIIVVDGGSKDRSPEIAKEYPFIRFYQLPQKLKGRGSALRYGVDQSLGDIVVFFPSDDEYEPNNIVDLVKAIQSQGAQAIFGSRAIKCLNLEERIRRIYRGKIFSYLISKYGGMSLSVLSLLLFKRFITDPLTGLKAFKRRLLLEMDLKAKGLELEVELIAKLSYQNEYILELPVEYFPRLKIEGKKTSILDGLYTILYFFRLRLLKSKQK